MLRLIFLAVGTLVAALIWAVLVFFSVSEGWIRTPLASSDTPDAFVAAARRLAEEESVGTLSLMLIEDGDRAGGFDISAGAPVDEDSVFQVASLSKWLTAWGVMVLAEEGAVDLDAPVETYLTRWTLPESEFDPSGVTLRRLLSHTAGLSDGLGYDGFDSAGDVQSLEESLTRAEDASPGNDGAVRIGAEPGSGWDYSGGGYTLMQLVIEEVSGDAFSEFMEARIFEPLGMNRTTFDYARAQDLGFAENYTPEGATEPYRHYTALGAASLFTTTADMARFIEAQTDEDGQDVLSEETLELMRTPHASQLGADIWGLGVMLYAPNGHGGHIIGHDGNNEPAINTAARFDPATGDGIVVLETGSRLLATRLAGEWVFWKTGKVDNLMFALAIERMLLWIAGGALLILIGGAWIGWRGSRKPRA
ncbi:serine hydrolase domain-containing protein [Marinicauda sp. Alg238-R41]|uniref:serine hydrolase domain-containing protein n=1 Tax=Marinicauda sp. Alg238-R41 TaxID=2993447 RepID=UPI0022E979D2|nr:serine hydrolase domain-containing protein [Marinicauda sp. Alg238-R41]